MCEICGCGRSEAHDQHNHIQVVDIEKSVLSENDDYAAKNRRYFFQKNIVAFNLVSSPGAGKTTLLTQTLIKYQNRIPMSVIVGDQQSDCDAQRLLKTGASALQINTGKMCHLDAHHVHHAIEDISLKKDSILWIENVGNLVCPALFDLGEALRIVILSVTEGDDKPLKYPYMFHGAHLLIINKIDLLPYVSFNIVDCVSYAKRINPQLQILKTAATQEQGLDEWEQWLQNVGASKLMV